MANIEQFISEYLEALGNNPTETGIDHKNLNNSVDGYVLKELQETNTWDSGRSSHQTHIAITGSEMSLFPQYTKNTPGFVDLSNNGRFKKDFVIRIPIQLLENNLLFLKNRTTTFKSFSNTINTYTHTAQTIRRSGDVQVEISYKTLDESNFIYFRNLLSTGCSIVFLKKKGKYEYLCLGIPNHLIMKYFNN